MRIEGFFLILGVWGWRCVRLRLLFSFPTVCKRLPPFAMRTIAAKLYRWRVIMFVKVVWFDRRNILERCSEDDLS
jgi:hypothetical protein